MFKRRQLMLLALTPWALPASAEPGTAKPAEGGDKIVCKNDREHRTGTNMRIGKGECRTEAEWLERQRATQRELTRLRDKQQTPGNALGR